MSSPAQRRRTIAGLQGGARVAALASLGLSIVSCQPRPGFGCAEDEQCRNAQGEPGVCSGVGACAYPDAACASGFRYSEHAPPPWAGTCVVAADDAGTTSPTASTGPTDTSTTSGPTESTSGSESSSDTASVPVCGDGVIEGDEQCDDGNDVESDGCNPDCRPSAVQLDSFMSGAPEHDAALSVVRLPSDDLILGGYLSADPSDLDLWLARYEPGGRQVWSYTEGGTAARNDVVTAVALSPDGEARAVGWVIPNAPKMETPRGQFWIAELEAETGQLRWRFEDGMPQPANDLLHGLVVLPGGDMIVAGRVGPAGTADFAVRRYAVADNDGEFEVSNVWAESFDGAAQTSDWAFAIAYDPAGRIVVGGALHSTDSDFDRHLRGLDLGGQPLEPPCEDFGGDDPLADDDLISDVAIAPDGALVAVGYATKAERQLRDLWVGYYAVGACQLTWAKTRVGTDGQDDGATAVAIDDLGRIVVGGYLGIDNGQDAWLGKYDATGELLWELEPVDGPGNGDDRIDDVLIGQGREITVAGRLSVPDQVDAWVARYTP